MLYNLLAEANKGLNWDEVGDALSALIAVTGPIIIFIAVLLVLHAIFNFFIPFYIRSIKKSQEKISEKEEAMQKTLHKIYEVQLKIEEIQKERLEIEKSRFEVEKNKISLEKEKSDFENEQKQFEQFKQFNDYINSKNLNK